jgi:hypothetical protein
LIASATPAAHPVDHMGDQGPAAKRDEGLAPADAAPAPRRPGSRPPDGIAGCHAHRDAPFTRPFLRCFTDADPTMTGQLICIRLRARSNPAIRRGERPLPMSDRDSRRQAFWSGARDALPFTIVVMPFAILFGVVGTEAGLNLAQVMGFSVG